jgi:hypothetical protein
MKTYTFEVQVATNETSRVRVEDAISINACSYDIAIDKLSASVQARHKDVNEIFIDRFSIKVK